MVVEKRVLIYFGILLAIFPPQAIIANGIIKLMLNVVQVIAALYYLFKVIQNGKITISCFLIILYSGVVFISTYLENGALYEAAIYIINILGFCLFLEFEVLADSKLILKCIKNYFSFIAVINYIYLLIGVYILHNRADASLFITVSNSITASLMFAVFSSILYDLTYLDKVSKKTILLALIIAHTELLVWSGTGMIGYFIILAFLFLGIIKKRLTRKLSFGVLNLISAGLFVSVTIFRAIDWFSFIIVDVLQKDISLTGRTKIWDHYMLRIAESPIIVHGVAYNTYGGLFAHSGYLDILVKSGVVGAILIILMIILAGRKLNMCGNNKIYNLISVFIFSFEVMMLAEMPSVVLLFGLILIATYYPIIEDNRRLVE